MKPLDRPRGLFRVGAMSTGRIEAFSDGVFAIVITLLVLEFRVPQVKGPEIGPELARGLLALVPKFLSYVLSFSIVCIWWVAHHHLFHLIRKSDRGLLWLNSLFLLWLAFIPFPTAMLGDYPGEPIAVMCYGVVMTLAGVAFSSMRYYAFYVGSLVDESIDRELLRRAMIKSALNPVLHFCAVLSSLVDVKIALALYVLLPLLFFIPSRLDRATYVRS